MKSKRPANWSNSDPRLPAMIWHKGKELQTAPKDETLRREAMAILRTLIETAIVTPTETGVEAALYGELGALMDRGRGSQGKRPRLFGAEAFALAGCGRAQPALTAGPRRPVSPNSSPSHGGNRGSIPLGDAGPQLST